MTALGLRVGLALALAGWPAAAQVAFENAWLRAPAPGQPVTGGYCDIANAASTQATIVAFRDADCRGDDCAIRVEMHETIQHEGMVRMRPIPRLVIAGNGTLSLAPGGKHLMVFGLASEAREARLRAVFADGAEQVVRFVVRPLGYSGGAPSGLEE